MRPAERNAYIREMLTGYIERALAGDGPAADRYQSERKVLERLIPIQTDGFRGITLTAIMGKLVRSDINTGTEFDSINPRGLFENAIYPVLRANRVPTAKSAPLNVAKNVQVLDEKWAEGRKPEDSALAAVDYVRRINRHWNDESFRDDLIMMFVQRLMAYAEEVGQLDVELPPLDQVPPIALGSRLANFAVEFPEGGSIPQFVVGALLVFSRESNTDYLSFDGMDASVFGTNTTSNKPADLWEKLPDGRLGNLYEVTCKEVKTARLDAAVDSFASLNAPNTPITFVCRLPEDASSLDLQESAIVYRGVMFQFIDIRDVIKLLFVLLTPSRQRDALEKIAEFIAEPSRPTKTKKAWARAFGVSHQKQ